MSPRRRDLRVGKKDLDMRTPKGSPQRYFSTNQCWRQEDGYNSIRFAEFKKLEQFVFCHPDDAGEQFQHLLKNATDLLDQYGLHWRYRDCTEDEGYHVSKTDIEVWTEAYGWMETHTCTYFGAQQAERFNIQNCHTLSCTGVASPRILTPLLEAGN